MSRKSLTIVAGIFLLSTLILLLSSEFGYFRVERFNRNPNGSVIEVLKVDTPEIVKVNGETGFVDNPTTLGENTGEVESRDYYLLFNISGIAPRETEVLMNYVLLGDMYYGIMKTDTKNLEPGFLSFAFELGNRTYGFSCPLTQEDIDDGNSFECFVPKEELYLFNFVIGSPGYLTCDGVRLGETLEGVLQIPFENLSTSCFYKFYPDKYDGKYVGFYLNESKRETNTLILPIDFSDESLFMIESTSG